MTKHTPAYAFKPYIIQRPAGGCQVLFPLSELDRLIGEALAFYLEGTGTQICVLRCRRRRRIIAMRRCPACGRNFSYWNPAKKYCSDRCRNLDWYRKKRADLRAGA